MKILPSTRVWLLAVLVVFLSLTTVSGVADADYADDEWDEAYEQTKEEWKAMVKTMEETKPKLEEYLKKYDEMEQFIYYQRNRKNYLEIAEFLGVDPSLAREKWDQVEQYFNKLNSAGIKTKLQGAISSLGTGISVAGKVNNAWDWAERFDPRKGKDDPTHGLKVIGEILKEGAGWIGAVPVLGPFLKQWIEGYATAIGEYVKALDGLSKKIKENTRQGALCGQQGVWLRQQASFRAASAEGFGGETCLTYFEKPIFKRLHSQIFVGQNYYFLYHSPSERGYFSTKAWTAKVYDWHGMLLNTRRMTPDWLAGRANSMTSELVSEAKSRFRLMNGIYKKTDPIWVIADRLGSWNIAADYGALAEDPFIANYLLDTQFHDVVNEFLAEVDRYLYASGFVQDAVSGKKIGGAALTLEVDNYGRQITTKADGSWELLFEGKVNGRTNLHVSHPGYRTYSETGGRFHTRSILGWEIRLEKDEGVVTISGRVLNTGKTPPETVAGASVTVTVPEDTKSGRPGVTANTTSGPDGFYSLRLTAKGSFDGAAATLVGQMDEQSKSVYVMLRGSAKSGIDILLDLSATAPANWTVVGTVVDSHGDPIPNATVVAGSLTANSSAEGRFAFPALDITAQLDQDQTPTLSLVASVTTAGGNSTAGLPTVATYTGTATTEVTLTIPVTMPVLVTITGTVQDVNGARLSGTTITGDNGLSGVSGAGGSFSLGPVWVYREEPITLTATQSDPASNQVFSSPPVSVAYTGNARISGVLLVIESVQDAEITLSGRVVDRSGNLLPGSVVSAGGVQVAAPDGSFTLAGIPHTLGALLAVQATVQSASGSAISGSIQLRPLELVTGGVVIPVEVDLAVPTLLAGFVRDVNGSPVAGAAVGTDHAANGVTDAAGRFQIGPVDLFRDETVTLTASIVNSSTGETFGGTSVVVTSTGTSPLAGIVLIVDAVQDVGVTVSGHVVDINGVTIPNSAVSAGGVTVSANGGSFTLSGIDHTLGEPLLVTATVQTAEGTSASGSASVTPRTPIVGGVVITVNVVMAADPPEDGDTDSDDDLDDAIDELDPGEVDLSALMDEYIAAVAAARESARDFSDVAGVFEQRLREVLASNDGVDCEDLSQSLSYALVETRDRLTEHDQDLSLLVRSYAILKSAMFSEGLVISNVDDSFTEANTRGGAMRSRYNDMKSRLRDDFGCDEDEVIRDGEEIAEGGADPDDIDSGGRGNDAELLEICGDGVDNDGDNEIDECDAGCCEGRAVIIVTDCGSAADDIFLVTLDTGASGVTPRGAATTFSDDLSPGSHSVTLQVLSAPDDLGTYCLTISVDGVLLLDVQGSPGEGTVETWDFVVPELGPGLLQRADPILQRVGASSMFEG